LQPGCGDFKLWCDVLGPNRLKLRYL